MGELTETMKRLRDEIVTSRHARVALHGDLVRQTHERRKLVSAWRAGFARDRAGAHRAWFGPTLAERQAAEKQQQHRLAEEAEAEARERQRRLAEQARAAARAEEPPHATPKAKPRKHEPTEPVEAPAAPELVAPSPQPHRRPFKASKKH